MANIAGSAINILNRIPRMEVLPHIVVDYEFIPLGKPRDEDTYIAEVQCKAELIRPLLKWMSVNFSSKEIKTLSYFGAIRTKYAGAQHGDHDFVSPNGVGYNDPTNRIYSKMWNLLCLHTVRPDITNEVTRGDYIEALLSTAYLSFLSTNRCEPIFLLSRDVIEDAHDIVMTIETESHGSPPFIAAKEIPPRTIAVMNFPFQNIW